MAHYAWLDENNIVVNVSVGVDETELINGLDTETFYSQATGHNIKRTSYNSKIRGNYAGIGMFYCDEHNLFMPAKCHDKAVLNVETARWDCTNKDHDSII
jgi:hypothetical protein